MFKLKRLAPNHFRQTSSDGHNRQRHDINWYDKYAQFWQHKQQLYNAQQYYIITYLLKLFNIAQQL